MPQVRHDAGNDERDEPAQAQGIVSKWRQKERLKTTAVALVLCLNIGVDPPDVIKISPCARLECWVDPLSMQPPKALDTIGRQAVAPLLLQDAWDAASAWLPGCGSSARHCRLRDCYGCCGAGKNLQAQYERWQPRAKYRAHLDPTMDDVKKLAQSCRRTAKVSAAPGLTAEPVLLPPLGMHPSRAVLYAALASLPLNPGAW